MKTIAAACAVLALALTGCASAPDTDPTPTMAEVAADSYNTAGKDGHTMTGTRMSKRTSTDRMLKAVGAQGAKDELRNAPRPGALVE